VHYEAIEDFRGEEPFYDMALGINKVPSSSTLRQRMNQLGDMDESDSLLKMLKEENAAMIKHQQVQLTPTLEKMIGLDLDVSPFDNSKSKKEGVKRTYKGFDGYAPMLAYLAEEGYEINVELRPGDQHCQKETPEFLEETICLARLVTPEPLLIRMDAGNDAADNLSILESAHQVDYIIKRNLRREDPKVWWQLAKEEGKLSQPRPGKKVYQGVTTRQKKLVIDGKEEIRSLNSIPSPNI